jgi:hypothetical protein
VGIRNPVLDSACQYPQKLAALWNVDTRGEMTPESQLRTGTSITAVARRGFPGIAVSWALAVSQSVALLRSDCETASVRDSYKKSPTLTAQLLPPPLPGRKCPVCFVLAVLERNRVEPTALSAHLA